MLAATWFLIKPLLDILGYVATVVVIFSIFAGIVAWFKGILPAMIRLGNGLAKRKIVIFAKPDAAASLESLLIDSGLILQRNIDCITKDEDFGKAEGVTLYLVYWPDWKDKIDSILDKKKDGTGLVIYSPYKKSDRIPDEVMERIDLHRNVAVTNFRGRLLNDIVVTMITTDQKSK